VSGGERGVILSGLKSINHQGHEVPRRKSKFIPL
jgi:hypothetical protein